MKRKKKSPRKKLITNLDSLWSRLTKLVHGRRCWWCGKTGNVQSDHIQNRHKYPTRWRIENCAILCVGCHLFRKKRDPALWAQMVINRIGQDAWEWLMWESNRQDKTDLEEVKKHLEEAERGIREKNDEKKNEPSAGSF